MRTPTQLVRPIAHRNHSHFIAVLLTEQRHRTHRPSLVLGHHVRVDIEILDQDFVHPRLDIAKDGTGDRLGAGEIET